ncbi:MAG: nucleotidyltransferase domain-containing protein [Nanoarchaeota archaeon]
MIANILDKNLAQITAYFLISPGSRHTRKEIKEQTELNNIPLDVTLTKLQSLNILKKEKNLFSLNFESDEIAVFLNAIQKEYKKFNVPYKIFMVLLDITESLSKVKHINSVTLFGSYAKLIYSENSDIDIAIIFSNGKKEQKTQEKKIDKILKKFGDKYKKVIEPRYFTEREIKDNKTKDFLIKDILKNGKVIL